MRTNFLIKNRPTFTLMAQGRTPERIRELIGKGLRGGADAFGVQLERLERKYHTKDAIKGIIDAAEDKPVYLTNYRDGENEGIDEDLLTEELFLSAESGAALIDIMGDFYCPSVNQITYDEKAVQKQKKAIKTIHSLGKDVLISSHTYCYLAYDEVFKIVSAQKERGADVAKIVTAAGNESELLSNFRITAKLKEEFGLHYLFLCIGAYCHNHRRIAPFISNGMLLCVAEYDDLSTPAQPLLSDVKKISELILTK